MEGDIPGIQLNTQLHMLADLGQHGYFHLLNCTSSEIQERIHKLSPLFEDFDLIFARLDNYGLDKAQYAVRILQMISPGGALVIECSSDSEFNEMWNNLKHEMVEIEVDRYRIVGKAVGMLLKPAGPENISGSACHREITISLDEMKVLSDRKVFRESFRRKLFRAIWNILSRLHDKYKEVQ